MAFPMSAYGLWGSTLPVSVWYRSFCLTLCIFTVHLWLIKKTKILIRRPEIPLSLYQELEILLNLYQDLEIPMGLDQELETPPVSRSGTEAGTGDPPLETGSGSKQIFLSLDLNTANV